MLVASCAVASRIAGDGLVKREKALHLYQTYSERGRALLHIYITFTTVYCYNCSILLLVIAVNLLRCLIHK